jgi:hypothetical protein
MWMLVKKDTAYTVIVVVVAAAVVMIVVADISGLPRTRCPRFIPISNSKALLQDDIVAAVVVTVVIAIHLNVKLEGATARRQSFTFSAKHISPFAIGTRRWRRHRVPCPYIKQPML